MFTYDYINDDAVIFVGGPLHNQIQPFKNYINEYHVSVSVPMPIEPFALFPNEYKTVTYTRKGVTFKVGHTIIYGNVFVMT